jgi:hypothetical protein
MDQQDFEIVDKWYLVDTNSVPAVYRIQPITTLLPHYNDTDPENRLKTLEVGSVKGHNYVLLTFWLTQAMTVPSPAAKGGGLSMGPAPSSHKTTFAT